MASVNTRLPMDSGTAFGGFSIEGVLGRGLSGIVYLARHGRMGRLVALKVLSQELSADSEFPMRFIRGATSFGRISHPNIASVDDVGETDGRLWVSTRLVDAVDASQLLTEYGRLPIGRVAAILDQLAVAIDYLHSQDMTSIDLTPANVLVNTRVTPETVTIVDNGVTRALVAPDMPEDAARREDIYTLAATVYELLTGQSPAAAGGKHYPVTPAKTLVAALPRECDVALQSALAMDPSRRFESAGAFASAFRRGLRATSAAPSESRKRSGRGGMWLAVGAATVLVVGGVAIYSGDDAPTKDDEAKAAAVVKPFGLHGVSRISPNGKALPAAAGADPAGDGKAVCTGVSVAAMGALTGPDKALASNIANGVKLAVERHNEHNPRCQVALVAADTQGSPQQARRVADTLVANNKVIGVIGPAYTDEVVQTGQKFTNARLTAISPSASGSGLTGNGWAAFFRGLADDNAQGTALGNYIKGPLAAKKACVIGDGSPDAMTQTAAVSTALGRAAVLNCSLQAPIGNSDAVSQRVLNADADVVFFAGQPHNAAQWLEALREAGVTAKFVAGDGANDPAFIETAGETARGSIVGAPWGPAAKSFATMYRAAYGADPGSYAAEGYDLATVLLRGIDSGKVKRVDLLNFVRNYDGLGTQGRYAWDADGELEVPGVWIYRAEGKK